jgi:hypothetical protein
MRDFFDDEIVIAYLPAQFANHSRLDVERVGADARCTVMSEW